MTALPFQQYDHALRDRFTLVWNANQGLPAEAFFEVADHSGYHRDQLAGLLDLSQKTMLRYRQENKRLSPVTSEMLLKLMALFRKGQDLFGDLAAFKRWLEKPAYGLGEQLPFDLLHTSGGMDLVLEELVRIEYGDLA